MKGILNIVASIAISGAMILFALNTPVTWYQVPIVEDKFGVAVTEVQGTDLLTAWPTLYNANLNALNNGKIENSTTSVDAITTLSNLVSIGTITTGTWNGTTIAVANGGTGSTTLSSNQVLLGNGSSALQTVVGYGTTGQVLTANGGATAPTWQSTVINQTLDYAWAGDHFFSGFLGVGGQFSATTSSFNVLNLYASSTAANPIVLNGIDYNTPATEGATSTVLATKGSGKLTFNTVGELGAGHFLIATTTSTAVNDTTTETNYGSQNTLADIEGGLLGTTGAIKGSFRITNFRDNSGGDDTVTFRVKLSGITVCDTAYIAPGNAIVTGFAEFTLASDGSDAKQTCIFNSWLNSTTAGTFQSGSDADTSTVNTANDQTLELTIQWTAQDGGDTETVTVSNFQAEFAGRP